MVAAQLRLGASWRIGIDEGASPGLVTAGLYQLCRNPIFLGMFVTLAGLVVLLPTWISAAVFVGTIVCIRHQVLAEEAYLTSTYGEAYQKYAGRVGRFLPGLGRLSRA
jgi:protein-S-isoprenylcysteine O-methyltransferase Ste14